MNKENNQLINEQIFDILENKIFTTELISGLAGDKILTKEESKVIKKILKETGDDLYVKILFHITYKAFPVEKAKEIWDEILKHKNYLSKVLKRNVEVTVAALDYLTNIKDEIKNPKLIGETFIGKIVELSSIDNLTKLYNRVYFFNKIKEEFVRYKRYKITFSLIIFDIDDFKKVNDLFGHQKGDEILSELGAVLINISRDLDICARYGGEEFVILLPHTDIDEAYKIAERIRKRVENIFNEELRITISLGIANCPNSSISMKTLIKKADDALLESKKLGKNQTRMK